MIDGFLQAVRSMKNKDAELVEFLDKFDGVCLEAKSDNVQEWSLHLLAAGKPDFRISPPSQHFVQTGRGASDRFLLGDFRECERNGGGSQAKLLEFTVIRELKLLDLLKFGNFH